MNKQLCIEENSFGRGLEYSKGDVEIQMSIKFEDSCIEKYSKFVSCIFLFSSWVYFNIKRGFFVMIFREGKGEQGILVVFIIFMDICSFYY